MGNTATYESQAGHYVGNFGKCYIFSRLELTETVNGDTSSISWVLYMRKDMSQGQGRGRVTGNVSIAGNTTRISIDKTIADTWTLISSGTVNDISHTSKTVEVIISSLTTDAYAVGFGILIDATETFELSVDDGGKLIVKAGNTVKRCTVYAVRNGAAQQLTAYVIKNGAAVKTKG